MTGLEPVTGERRLPSSSRPGLASCMVERLTATLQSWCPPPASGSSGGRPRQHPVADGDDEAALLRQGQEADRGDGTMHRVLPAQRRLGADHLTAAGRVFGLIVQGQLPAPGRVAQLPLQGTAGGRWRSWRCRRSSSRCAPLLGVVHGGVGVEGQLVQAGAVLGIDGDADAGGDVQAVMFPLVGLRQGGQQPLGEGRGLAQIPGARASTNSSP